MEISEMMKASPLGGYHHWAVPTLNGEHTKLAIWDNPAGRPVVSLAVNLVGIVITLIEIIGGIVASVFLALPALCVPGARGLLERAGKTIACGARMLVIYPLYLLVAHTLGFCCCFDAVKGTANS